jgi:hypothetical protein
MKDENILEMQLTDYMQQQMKEIFDLEIEMLQGEYKKLPNGMHYHKIFIPPHKEELVMRFFKMCVEHPQVDCKLMGERINKN